MAYVPKPNETEFQLVPEGTWPAICYRVIDLGTQKTSYQGQEKHQHKVLISWEICDDETKMDDGRPFTIGQNYTWSMSEKANLRADLESWRGKSFTDKEMGPGGFEINNVIGVGCLLSIVHTTKGEKTYANIKSVMKLPKGMTVPAPVNDRNFVWLSKDEFIQANWDSLTDGLKAKIAASPEYQQMISGEPVSQDVPHPSQYGNGAFDDSEIPF